MSQRYQKHDSDEPVQKKLHREWKDTWIAAQKMVCSDPFWNLIVVCCCSAAVAATAMLSLWLHRGHFSPSSSQETVHFEQTYPVSNRTDRCTSANWADGKWVFSNKTRPYKEFMCFRDPRKHWQFIWKPFLTECDIPPFNTTYYNPHLEGKTIHFVGDSHYDQAGQALKVRCDAVGKESGAEPCKFKTQHNFIKRLLAVDNTSSELLHPTVLQAIKQRAHVLVIGIGHHYAHNKIPDFTIDDNEALALHSIDVLLRTLKTLQYTGIVVCTHTLYVSFQVVSGTQVDRVTSLIPGRL